MKYLISSEDTAKRWKLQTNKSYTLEELKHALTKYAATNSDNITEERLKHSFEVYIKDKVIVEDKK